jgi:hypothetical protein
MKYLLCVAAVGVALASPQDGDRARGLVESLADPGIEAREAAMESLVKLGDEAIPWLRKAAQSDDPERRCRAEYALQEIGRRARLKTVFREIPPFDLACKDAPLEEALRELAARTGLKVLQDETFGRVRVSLDLAGATLMQALDAMCREAGDLQWSFTAPDGVRLSRQTFVERPGCYSGGFKVALRKLEVYRSSNFREAGGLVWIHLQAQTEPGLQISGSPAFQISQVLDETGNELSPDSDRAALFPQGLPPSPAGNERLGSMDSKPFTFGSLNRFARKLARVRGTATFNFALGTEEVVLKDLAQESSASVGEMAIQVSDGYNGSLQVTLTRPPEGARPDAFVDTSSFQIVDSEGAEQRPLAAADVQTYPGAGNSVCFYVRFNRTAPAVARSIRFKVVTEFYEKKVPFEFTDVPLP